MEAEKAQKAAVSVMGTTATLSAPKEAPAVDEQKKAEADKAQNPEKKAATASMMGLGTTSEKSLKKNEPPVTGKLRYCNPLQ